MDTLAPAMAPASDTGEKRPRTFQCREALWTSLAQVASELECTVDFLVNDAIKHYLRQRQRLAAPPPPAPILGPRPPAQLGAPAAPFLAAARPVERPTPPAALAARAPAALPPVPPSLPRPPLPAPPGFPPAPLPTRSGAVPLTAPPGFVAPPPPVPPAPGFAPPPLPIPPALAAPPPPLPVPPGFAPPLPVPPGFAAPPPSFRAAPPPPPPPLPALRGPAAPPPAPPVPAGPPRLTATYGDRTVEVDRGGFVIGRGKQTAGLTIKDPNISRHHAAVEVHEGVFYVVDMGSTNGTRINGVQVQRRAIADGDVLEICDHQIRFSYARG